MSTSSKRSSGVSTAIYTTLALNATGERLIDRTKPSAFTIKIANTLEEREAVFHLGYIIYREKGFIPQNAKQHLVSDYDFNSSTIILIAQDQDENIAGSVTIVFDEDSCLPAESIYADELCSLRGKGARIAEISRLIIDPKYRNAKEILVLLFNYLYIYVSHVADYSHLVIQVNPRHKDYYRMLLSFEEIGQEKLYPKVQNAPAVLLALYLSAAEEERKKVNMHDKSTKNTRSLYPFFIDQAQENLVSHDLAAQVKVMSIEEKIYFGFSASLAFS